MFFPSVGSRLVLRLCRSPLPCAAIGGASGVHPHPTPTLLFFRRCSALVSPHDRDTPDHRPAASSLLAAPAHPRALAVPVSPAATPHRPYPFG